VAWLMYYVTLISMLFCDEWMIKIALCNRKQKIDLWLNTFQHTCTLTFLVHFWSLSFEMHIYVCSYQSFIAAKFLAFSFKVQSIFHFCMTTVSYFKLIYFSSLRLVCHYEWLFSSYLKVWALVIEILSY